jgi:4-diphosphocytidyl-2-C-methyl-D-erythritol kinase
MVAAAVRAQAKINLYLRVTGREASGYHHIETLFCRIQLADVVSVRLTPTSRTLDCTGPALPRRGLGSVAENLAWRAANAYADEARWPRGFALELEKYIPVSAGLGGGSADAGAVLRIMNTLNARPIPNQRLLELARSLGSDVPFLTQDHASLALAWRRGDEWHPLPELPERACLLAIPPGGVSTAEAYAWLDADRGWQRDVAATDAVNAIPSVLSWNDVRRLAHNDFEKVVFAKCPDVQKAWLYLSETASGIDPASFARMSGSGSAVFAIVASGLLAAVERPAPPDGVNVSVTSTASRVEPVQPID